jgi:hypothetical protein
MIYSIKFERVGSGCLWNLVFARALDEIARLSYGIKMIDVYPPPCWQSISTSNHFSI